MKIKNFIFLSLVVVSVVFPGVSSSNIGKILSNVSGNEMCFILGKENNDLIKQCMEKNDYRIAAHKMESKFNQLLCENRISKLAELGGKNISQRLHFEKIIDLVVDECRNVTKKIDEKYERQYIDLLGRLEEDKDHHLSWLSE